MNEKTVQDIIKVSNTLKKKLGTLKRKRFLEQEETERVLAPISRPLQKLAAKDEIIDLTKNGDDEQQQQQFIDPETKAQFVAQFADDLTFGPRYDEKIGVTSLGNLWYRVKDDEIKVGTKAYTKTPGLFELIHRKHPNLKKVTAIDKKNYQEILKLTSIHHRGFDPKKPLRSSGGFKWMQIIKPILEEDFSGVSSPGRLSPAPGPSTASPQSPKGTGIVSCNRPNPRIIVSETDPNKLCERLKLLVASQTAGHTGLRAEIKAILNQLRKGGYIL